MAVLEAARQQQSSTGSRRRRPRWTGNGDNKQAPITSIVMTGLATTAVAITCQRRQWPDRHCCQFHLCSGMKPSPDVLVQITPLPLEP